MKNKINLRLVLIAIVAIVATTIGITLVYYGLFQRQVRDDLSVAAKLLRDTRYFENENIQANQIDLSTDIDEIRVTWIAADGTVLYDNDKSVSELANHKDRPEIQEAFMNGVGESVRQSDTMNKNTFYYALLIENGTVLRVSTEAGSIWSVFFTAAPMVVILVLIIIIACVAISAMLTKQLVDPIEVMGQNIEDVSIEPPYKELIPFAHMIRKQHEDILSSAKVRQDFTANVSHELKTPLTAISGYAELIDNEMVSDEQAKHFVKEIRKNAQRLLSLINDIIRLSELDRSANEPIVEIVDLYEVVLECLEGLRVNANKRQIEIEFTGDHVNVRGNREMLSELVDNLVQNAIRYNNENGKVWISIDGDSEPTLTVKDNGIGIPVEDQQRVFERFYRVDKSRSKATGGTGLGLAIVKHIVDIHDAKIELESRVGEGTSIRVAF